MKVSITGPTDMVPPEILATAILLPHPPDADSMALYCRRSNGTLTIYFYNRSAYLGHHVYRMSDWSMIDDTTNRFK